MRRVVIVVPSAFTLCNLLFGMWSMVLASRGDFYRAGWYIVFAGILDALDGRLARLSGSGTRFGAELDSLVDLVSFGVAPAYLMYQLEFASAGQFAWLFCYAYVAMAALRLARFNITQAGKPKTMFIGLPSPAAGMTLATYYPFTLTGLYEATLAHVPWRTTLIFLMVILSLLMMTNIRYPTLPRMGFRTWPGRLGLVINLTILIMGIWQHDVFFFPLGVTFMAYGLVRAAVLGLQERDGVEVMPEGPVVFPDESALEEAYGRGRRGVPPPARGAGGGERA
jgi:CDP-diacylglycerol---serine O-phosphatidyltransferase